VPIRGYILPRRGPVYAEEIGDEEAGKIHEDTRFIIQAVLKDFVRRKMESAEQINGFLDALVVYIKSLLLLDPLPESLGLRIFQPSLSILYFYLSRRDELAGLEEAKKPYGREGMRFLDAIPSLFSPSLYTDEMRRKLYNALRFPADTRPGANTSSLLIHSLTSSGIASSILMNKVDPRSPGFSRGLAALRLACLFHDIGKMVDWRRHEEVSSDELRSIFDGYVERDAEEIVSGAAELIKGEEASPLKKLLREADAIASASDRVVEIFRSLMEDSPLFKEIEKRAKEFGSFEKAYMNWDFWDSIGKDLVRELTEEFCRRASAISGPTFERIAGIKPRILSEDVEVVRVDVRGIQSYIRLNDIWAMNGASREIDNILYVGLPAYLVEKLGLPPESILYFGGGNLTLVLPRRLADLMEDVCGYFNRTFFRETQSHLIYGRSPLYNSIFWINSEIDLSLMSKKAGFWAVRQEARSFEVDPNIYAKCEVCGRSYAKHVSEEKGVCEACKRRLETGRNQHFRVRADALGLEWDKLSKQVIEYIAGHSAEGLEPGEEQLNCAIVKFDGNLIGQLMGSSISITDACERSFRIDSSVKIAVRSFIEALPDEDRRRLILGLMYVGGDDGVILMPSRIALPFALHILNEYYLNMGCKSSLSIGILAVKPKHPLINAVEASDMLLRIVKSGDGVRDLAYRAHSSPVSQPSGEFRGALSFFVADTGWVTRETIAEVLSEMEDDGLSRMASSYILADPSRDGSILRLAAVVDEGFSRLDERPEELVKTAERHFDDSTRLKLIRGAIHDVMRSSKFERVSREVFLLYMIKEARSNPDKEKREVLNGFVDKLVEKKGGERRLLLQDLYLLVKLLGGGRV